jgi:hypothetical protein
MPPALFAATLPHWRNASVVLSLLRCAIALPLFSACDEQAWCSRRACARQGIEEGISGMTRRPFGSGRSAVLNRCSKNSPRRHPGVRHEGIGHHDPLLSGQRHGTRDGCQARMEAWLITHVVLRKEAFQGAAPSQLGGCACRPLTEKGTKQHGVLRGTPLEHVRNIRLHCPGESMGDPDPILHQATPVCNPWGHGAHLGTLGHERRELLAVPQEALALEFGIGRIVLRAARRTGLAISRQPHRIEVQEPETLLWTSGLDKGALMKFQSQSDGLALKALQQVRDPRIHHCWPGSQGLPFSFVSARNLQTDIVLRLGPSEADEGRKLLRGASGHVAPRIGDERIGQGHASWRWAKAL